MENIIALESDEEYNNIIPLENCCDDSDCEDTSTKKSSCCKDCSEEETIIKNGCENDDSQNDSCNDNCCESEEQKPVIAVVSSTQKCCGENSDDSCCESEEQKPIIANTNECKSSCCGSTEKPPGYKMNKKYDKMLNYLKTAEEVNQCCPLCWENVGYQCCKQSCCDLVCCVLELISVSVDEQILTEVSSISNINKNVNGSSSAITTNFQVGGMTCADCATSLENHLNKNPLVLAVRVSLLTHKTEVVHKTSIDASTIIQEIRKIGFSAEELAAPNSVRLTVHLEDFNSDVWSKIENFKKFPGITSTSADVKVGILNIDYNPATTGARALFAHLKEVGVSGTLPQGSSESLKDIEEKKWRNYFIASAALSFPVIFFAFVFPSFAATNSAFEKSLLPGLSVKVFLEWMLSTPIQIWAGMPLYKSAYAALRHSKTANMDTLVILSTSTAYAYSFISAIITIATPSYKGETFFETPAILLTLIMLGRYLEASAKGKTSNALGKLLELQAHTATLLSDSNEIEIDTRLAQRSDIVKVMPGSKIPTDGIIVYGSSNINESMITGESMPVIKTVGSFVYGGTMNQQGTIHVQVSRTIAEGTISSIAKLVENAQSAKTNAQRTADVISSYFVPFIVVLACSVFVIWVTLALTNSVTVTLSPIPFALQFFIATLVISCPCAIALAVPTAIMVGTGVGAKLGILFKSGPVIELYHKVNTIVFDKTGTLTHGAPKVVKYVIFQEKFSENFLKLVGSAELGSEHVLGKAIAKYAQETCTLVEPFGYKAEPGKGLQCKVSNYKMIIGTKQWLEENGVISNTEINKVVRSLESKAYTVVCVAINKQFAGVLALSDTLRDEAKEVIQNLHIMGIEVWMLSGDNTKTAKAIASQLGISNVIGKALPGDKAAKITELQKQGKIVAMVGDGINDSPALTKADVGIAVAVGNDIALEAANIVLMKSDLRDVLIGLELSKKIFKKIQINFAWAFFYNMIGIPLAAGALYPLKEIYVPPALAGLSEILSSLPVVLFSLMLYSFKPTAI